MIQTIITVPPDAMRLLAQAPAGQALELGTVPAGSTFQGTRARDDGAVEVVFVSDPGPLPPVTISIGVAGK